MPPIILFLAKHPQVAEYDLSALRFIVTGAATLDAGTQVAVSEQLGVPIRQGWGMTEVSQAAFSPLSFPPVPGSSGRALPGTRLKVVDPDTGAPRGVGEKGELCVSGPQVRPAERSSLSFMQQAGGAARRTPPHRRSDRTSNSLHYLQAVLRGGARLA